MGLDCDLGAAFIKERELGPCFRRYKRNFRNREAQFSSFASDTLCTVSTEIGSSASLWHLGKNSERVSPRHSPALPPYPSLIFKGSIL